MFVHTHIHICTNQTTNQGNQGICLGAVISELKRFVLEGERHKTQGVHKFIRYKTSFNGII